MIPENGVCTPVCTNSPETAHETAGSGVADSFAEAIAGIMRLPLSDADKAEAVRRLLADTAKQP